VKDSPGSRRHAGGKRRHNYRDQVQPSMILRSRLVAVALVALPLLGVLVAGQSPDQLTATARTPFVPASSSSTPPAQSLARSDNATASSLDWAGYAATDATFDNVAGAWTEPSVTCPGGKVEQAAFWVGIDGYSSTDPTVQQVGTDSDCTKGKNGGPNYYAWYQMFPSSVVVLPQASYPVSPGDAISASVSISGSSYVLSITDNGRWHYSTTQAPTITPENSSAEWIAEAPCNTSGSKCKTLPLSDFGSINFTSATANSEPISSLDNVQINMTTKNSKKTLAKTSNLSGGNAFSVTWKAST
jgi:hypothetical protein